MKAIDQLNLLTMILFPNAKINIGLNVVSKRSDGYHNLETIFYPISWSDSLEIVKSDEQKFSCSGIEIPGQGNLCQKAYQLLHSEFNLPNVHIHLHKNIPIGAGLGGGSSDAAFTLLGLNDLFDLQLSKSQLKSFASKLGADCPFFIENKTCLASGIGDQLTTIELDLSNCFLLVVTPNIHVSTADAYSSLVPMPSNAVLTDLIAYPMSEWKMKNDFEKGVFDQYPKIKSIKEKMIQNGALYASMSGSGSSVFGFFSEKPSLVFEDCRYHLQQILA